MPEGRDAADADAVGSTDGARGRQPAGRGRGPDPTWPLRTWVAVVSHPRRFFAKSVRPGEQGTGLLFAMAVVLVAAGTRLATRPGTVPSLVGGTAVSALLVLGLVVLLVAPVGLHLVAALQILLLRPLVPERAGVAETVQVLAYATAPCALAGLPIPTLRLLCAVYGSWLLVQGLAAVHGTTRWRAAVAGLVPAVVVFGYGFGGFAALAGLLASASG